MRFLIVLLVGCAGAMGGPNGPSGDDDPTPDGSQMEPDAKPPVTCGGVTCHSDQSCVDNTCTFACVGSKVPGDYATIQTAIDALAATATDSTICLEDATYNEANIYIRDQDANGKTLRIVGAAMDRSIINGRITVTTGWRTVRLQGLQIKNPNTTALSTSGNNNNTLELVGVKLSGQTGMEAYQKQTILLDGCEIAATTGYGVSLYANSTSPLVVRIQNSYLHGGYSVRSSSASGYDVQLAFVNNLVKGSQVGMDISGTTTATIANNIFTGTTGTAVQWFAPATVERHDNALFDNMTNYGGLASDGPNTIKVDCMLGNTGIPTLAAGSPCRDVASTATAPMHDFYGTARGTKPDLGPVEAL